MTLVRKGSTTGLDYSVAGLTVAIIFMAFAAAVPMVALGGDCSEGNAYLCLWSAQIFILAPILSACLSGALYWNGRRSRPWPDGWLRVILGSAVLAQLSVTAFGALLFLPRGLHKFLSGGVMIPQGLAVGVVLGALYCVALSLVTARHTRVR